MHRTLYPSSVMATFLPCLQCCMNVIKNQVFFYKLSGCGLDSHWSPLTFRYHTCFKQEIPWHSHNYSQLNHLGQFGLMVECLFTNYMVADIRPLAWQLAHQTTVAATLPWFPQYNILECVFWFETIIFFVLLASLTL